MYTENHSNNLLVNLFTCGHFTSLEACFRYTLDLGKKGWNISRGQLHGWSASRNILGVGFHDPFWDISSPFSSTKFSHFGQFSTDPTRNNVNPTSVNIIHKIASTFVWVLSNFLSQSTHFCVSFHRWEHEVCPCYMSHPLFALLERGGNCDTWTMADKLANPSPIIATQYKHDYQRCWSIKAITSEISSFSLPLAGTGIQILLKLWENCDNALGSLIMQLVYNNEYYSSFFLVGLPGGEQFHPINGGFDSLGWFLVMLGES